MCEKTKNKLERLSKCKLIFTITPIQVQNTSKSNVCVGDAQLSNTLV